MTDDPSKPPGEIGARSRPGVRDVDVGAAHRFSRDRRTPRATNRTWAAFIGVNDYDDQFPSLEFCADDARELASVFSELSTASGDQDGPLIRLLIDSDGDRLLRPTRANIIRAVEDITNRAKADDRLVFGFFGHGMEYQGQSYLVPLDAIDGRPEDTAISLSWIARTLSLCKARFKLLLVDACHSGTLRGRDGTNAMSEQFRNSLQAFGASEGWAVFASSKQNERSYDDPDLGHGVFSYHLIQGLRGAATDRTSGQITLGSLADYVTTSVVDWSYKNGRRQTPELHSQIAGTLTLADPPVDETVWIAIMGTKGGAGKSTIATAMAEIIASAGHDVLLIDADMESAGLTKYLEGRAQQQPFIRTVLDAAYHKAGDSSGHDLPWRTWDVTPGYLREERFGDIMLVPARRKIDGRDAWLPLARIQPDETRNAMVLDILNELYEGLRSSGTAIDCVIVDAGAENNPLVSAAFRKASYGYLVSSPNPEFRFEIPRLEGMHRLRYPAHRFDGMNIIVNRATAESVSLWEGQQGAYFVQEDAAVQRTSALGKDYDFHGVGLNRFYRQILRIMNETFRKNDHQSRLLPSEIDVWITPFIRALQGTPARILRKWQFRFLLPAFCAALIVGVTLIAAGAMIFGRTSDDVSGVETAEPVEIADQGQQTAAIADVVRDADRAHFTFDGRRVVLKGNIPDDEMKRMETTLKQFPLYQVAVVRASLRHAERVQAALEQQSRWRFFALGDAMVGMALIVAALFVGTQLRRRKSMLHSIAGLETKGSEELRRFAEKLLLAPINKPDLVWLRNQFRMNSPSSVESWFIEGGERAARL